MESAIANTHDFFEFFPSFPLGLPLSRYVSFLSYVIFLVLDASFLTVCSLSHDNLPVVETNNSNLSVVQHTTILLFNDIQSNACGKGKLSSMQSFRDLASFVLWFHHSLGLRVFQWIICNFPKVGEERESVCRGHQGGCKNHMPERGECHFLDQA